MWTTQASRRVVDTRRSGAVTHVSVAFSMHTPLASQEGQQAIHTAEGGGPVRNRTARQDSTSCLRVMPTFRFGLRARPEAARIEDRKREERGSGWLPPCLPR